MTILAIKLWITLNSPRPRNYDDILQGFEGMTSYCLGSFLLHLCLGPSKTDPSRSRKRNMHVKIKIGAKKANA